MNGGRTHRWLATAVAAAVATVAALAVAAVPAGAHAEIRTSEPPRDGTAEEGVDELRLTFITMDPSEPVVVSVLDPDGNEMVDGDVEVGEESPSGIEVVVPVEPLDLGLHLVTWRAMSTDGDGITADSFEFTVEEGGGGGFRIWLLWIVALGIPAAVLLRPGARRRKRSP